jgi:hypothetical protein
VETGRLVVLIGVVGLQWMPGRVDWCGVTGVTGRDGFKLRLDAICFVSSEAWTPVPGDRDRGTAMGDVGLACALMRLDI